MMTTQSRPGATKLVSLVIAASVSIGVVGCSSGHLTPSGPISTGETSSSASAQNMVDVEKVWATHPLPPCADYLGTDRTAPPGLSVPDYDSVAKGLAGVQSPASETWVREKLGWLTKWLAKVRADIISDPDSSGSKAEKKTFDSYVEHVRVELVAGHSSGDPTDDIYPEGC